MIGKSRIGALIEEKLAGLNNIEALRRLTTEGVPATIPMPMDPGLLLQQPKLL